MKTLLLVISMLLIPTLATAEPFLTCDPQADVETYAVYVDGVLFQDNIPAEPDGSLFLDLVDLPRPAPGQAYDFTATASNVWGTSPLSDVYTAPRGLFKPANLKLQ